MVYNEFRIVVIKMKKVCKIAIILIIMLSIQFQMNYCYAAIFDDPDSKVETLKPDEIGDEKELVDKASIIVSVIRNIGIVIAVISLMIIGIRTMVGSAEEKSAYKEALPGYIIGVVLVVSITMLPTIIYEIMKKMNSQI